MSSFTRKSTPSSLVIINTHVHKKNMEIEIKQTLFMLDLRLCNEVMQGPNYNGLLTFLVLYGPDFLMNY